MDILSNLSQIVPNIPVEKKITHFFQFTWNCLWNMNCCHTPYLLTIVYTYVVSRRWGVGLTAKLNSQHTPLYYGSYNTVWVDYMSSFRFWYCILEVWIDVASVVVHCYCFMSTTDHKTSCSKGRVGLSEAGVLHWMHMCLINDAMQHTRLVCHRTKVQHALKVSSEGLDATVMRAEYEQQSYSKW